jgi:hypothetical protein
MKLDSGSEGRMRYKYCLTLLSPGTIFMQPTPEQTQELSDYAVEAEVSKTIDFDRPLTSDW